MDWVIALAVGSGIALNFGLNALGMALERIQPVQVIPVRERVRGAWFAAFGLTAMHFTWPAIGALETAFINQMGGGLIELRDDGGLWFAASAIVYVLAMDCLQYWRHRAEHTFPFLWAMHSFHHNDRSFNTFTTQRVYWLALVLQSAFTYPIMALLFKVPPSVLFVWVVLQTVTRATNHLNVRLHLGRLGLWIMGPQYHRIHHSIERKHWDKNFADVFPIWDLIFGTAWSPAPDEWPETGIDGKTQPEGMSDALLWPFRYARNIPRRRKAQSGVKARAPA